MSDDQLSGMHFFVTFSMLTDMILVQKILNQFQKNMKRMKITCFSRFQPLFFSVEIL